VKVRIHNFSKNYIIRIAALIVLDSISIFVTSFFSLIIRFDFSLSNIPVIYLEKAMYLLPINLVITIFLYCIFKLYKSVWRYASATELLNIGIAVFLSTGIQMIIMSVMKLGLPRSYSFLYGFLLFCFTTGIRFSYRIARMLNVKRRFNISGAKKKKCMVIGAGSAGNAIIKEIENSSYISLQVCCVIDDDVSGCKGKLLRGIQIIGGREKIKEAVEEYGIEEIIIAIPTATPSQLKPIINICKDTKCGLKITPGIYQLVNGEVSVSKLREVDIEDLLGRAPIQVNMKEIMGYVEHKIVMVTGGGGSIGSELLRQLAKHNPKQLIIVDIYENSTYEIQQELLGKYPQLDLVVRIASVRNTNRIDSIFAKYKPEIVYHAAAHKHVPLMEDSPNEAIKNNVFGTYKTAFTASKYGVEKFVLISTDKAVNPTNIMGASKRICEMIIQKMNKESKTEFVAVRFGNVLGSNGSVIPLFKKQIAYGGPVTVTDPEIIRYFMTIPEAVSLVLQAGAYAKGGEIFVLDMGEPIKILDLAKNLIQLSGYKEDDILIEFIGLRPGEKMYEELLMSEEGLENTENKRIYIGKPIDYNEKEFTEQLETLRKVAESDSTDIRKYVQKIVKNYKVIDNNKKH
jgi:FlaA1/EpsC-like NDP-sugar epimerase